MEQTKVPTAEEILGLPFYPDQCGGLIECVTKQDALKAILKHTRIHLSLLAKEIADKGQVETLRVDGIFRTIGDKSYERISQSSIETILSNYLIETK